MPLKKIHIITIAVLGMCASSHAFAFCSAPSLYSSPPNPPGNYAKPSVPMCLSGYQFSGEHDCSEWELNSYIDEVNEYIRKVYDYARDAALFAEEAQAFADGALSYAECEAEDVKEPLN